MIALPDMIESKVVKGLDHYSLGSDWSEEQLIQKATRVRQN